MLPNFYILEKYFEVFYTIIYLSWYFTSKSWLLNVYFLAANIHIGILSLFYFDGYSPLLDSLGHGTLQSI